MTLNFDIVTLIKVKDQVS